MKAFNLPASAIKKYFLKIDKFRGGSNGLINEVRLGQNFAASVTNKQQVADGVWQTRPGLDFYGKPIGGVGNTDYRIEAFTEYKTSTGDIELIVYARYSGDGLAHIMKSSDDGETWAEIDATKTFTSGARPYFLQINNRLYVSNGTDPLTYYDGSTLNRYTQINAPSAPTGALTTLTTGSYNNYYKLVAVNAIGFTTASNALLQTTNKDRSTWTTTEKVTLSWSAVSGATGYQIFWGDMTGDEHYIAETSGTSFEDFGTTVANPYIEIPDDNTTGAPKFQSMEISGNRIWGTKDPAAKYRVYYSGTGVYLGYFSPFYGGGYIDLEKGGLNEPQAVQHYRTGKGDPAITVLCSDPYGNGAIFQIELTSTTVGDVTFTIPVAYKIVGATGGSSPFFVAKVNDDIVFGSEKRISSLRNKEQMFQVLTTNDLTAPHRPNYEALQTTHINKFIAYYKAPRIYFCMRKNPITPSSTNPYYNDITAVFDMERNNWSWAWDIGFECIGEHLDSQGSRRLLACMANPNDRPHRLTDVINPGCLIEISDDFVGDFGTPFYQEYLSPLLPVSSDSTDMAKVQNALFEVGELAGSVNVEVIGIKKGEPKLPINVETISESRASTGFGVDLFSGFLFSGTEEESTTVTQTTQKKNVRVNEKLYYIQFRTYSQDTPTKYQLLSIQAKGFLMPSRPDSNW